MNGSKVSFQGIADLFRLRRIRRAIVSWDWLKLSQKWSFGDTSDIPEITNVAIDNRNQKMPGAV
jgi:hypothetical protein